MCIRDRAEGEQQKSLFLRGVSDTGFILKTITTEEYETSEDTQADIERMENATVHRVFELPFDGGPEHELLCYRGNAYYEEMCIRDRLLTVHKTRYGKHHLYPSAGKGGQLYPCLLYTSRCV